MPPTPATPSLLFLEQTDFSLRLASCSGAHGARCVEQIREIPVGDTAALASAAQEVFRGTSSPVVCALRPESRVVHLAAAAEARSFAGIAGARRFAVQPAFAALASGGLAVTAARGGGSAGDAPWLAVLGAGNFRAQAGTLLGTVKLSPGPLLSAVHVAAGALVRSATGPTLLLEVGVRGSQALLAGPAGIEKVAPVALGLDQIAAAVQQVLGLKFRGTAQKLLLHEDYDFGEAAPAIAAQLAPALKSDLAGLLPSGAPVALLVSGIPARQQWLADKLGGALGLATFQPDLAAECKRAGLTCAPPIDPAKLSPAWFGFLNLLGAYSEKSGAWQAEWLAAAEASAPVASAAVVEAPAPSAGMGNPRPEAAPAAKPAAAPAPTPATKATAVAVPPTPAKPVAASAENPKPSAPAPVKAKATESAVHYSTRPAPDQAADKKAKARAAKEEAPRAAPVQAPAGSQERAGTARSLPVKPAAFAAALLVLLGVGGYIYVQRQEAARLAEEKARTEQRLKDESARLQAAEKKAREEAEARQKFEFSLSQKLAATEAARAQAENEAKAQAAARLANARGQLIIVTEPAGATVTVGSLPPRPSPATFDDIHIGTYPVSIALAGHDPAQLMVEVKENATTQPDAVRLTAIVGTLQLASEPGGAEFELRPANALVLDPAARRTGKTPASFADLAPGDYFVTFSREGWAPHTESVSVLRDSIAHAAWTFPKGTVKITSFPSGATVKRDGTRLGTTPLTLTDIAPGEMTFEVSQDRFRPATVHGKLEGGATLGLEADLVTLEGYTLPSELESSPVPVMVVQPELPESLARTAGRVEIEITIDQDGNVKDPDVLRAPNSRLGKLCLAAAMKWKFKPGVAHGRPVNVRVTLPFEIAAQ